MGSFVFKWDHPEASEVYVTGTFDNWEKTEKLVKTGETFQKNVTLPSAAEKIYYKFVVDGNWVTDHTAPQETDASGNLNNVLTTDRIIKHTPETAGLMAGVAPTSTTAALAKDVPLEKAPIANTASSDLPGTFPETPAAIEKGDFSVNPLPAADGAVNPIKLAPGEKVPDPSTFTNNTVTSGVHDDPELVAAAKKAESEPTFGVSPLPAFAGGVNPVTVAPGEKIPTSDKLTANTIHSSVTTDKESYEKSGGLGNAPVLPPVVAPAADRELNGTGVFNMPAAKDLIPESSLPMGAAAVGSFDASPMLQSAGPRSTTAQLAAAVPLESSKVPEVVKESQKEAGVAPEASAVPAEVSEKSAVEKELLKEVPVAPATSEGTGGKGTNRSEKGITAGEAAAAIGGAAVSLGGATAAHASGASNLPPSVTSRIPESVQNSIASMNATSNGKAIAKDTPAVVKESIAESGQSPEAAANEEAVLEKKAVEKELLSEIKPETAAGEPAPKITATGMPAGLSAPAAGDAIDSRDVSPRTVPGTHTETQTAPTVTSGVAAAAKEKTSAAPVTPSKSTGTGPAATPGSSKTADSPSSSATDKADKKKKRTSFFGKLKAKLSSKD